MSLLEGHADVVMDGVGPEVIPTVDEIREKFDQRRKGAGYARPAAAPAARPRRQDGAVPRRRRLRARRRRQGRHGGLQRGLGRAAPTCPRKAEIGDPARLGRAACTADARRRWRSTPPSRPSRLAVRTRPGRPRPGQPVLVACSGGADSLALLAAAGVRGPRAGRGTCVGVTVDHGLQAGSAERAARVRRRRWPRLGADDDGRGAVGVEAAGQGPEAAAREARYAVARGGRRAVRVAGRPARPHPRRPGRDRAARARPWLRCPVAGRDAPRLRRLPPAAARPDPRDRPRPPAGPRASSGGPTRTTRTRASPGSRVRQRVLPVLEEELGPGVAAALARTADHAAGATARGLDELAAGGSTHGW